MNLISMCAQFLDQLCLFKKFKVNIITKKYLLIFKYLYLKLGHLKNQTYILLLMVDNFHDDLWRILFQIDRQQIFVMYLFIFKNEIKKFFLITIYSIKIKENIPLVANKRVK